MPFIKGHPFYGSGKGRYKKGNKPWNFKGRIKRGKYICLYIPDHPFSQKQGYVYEHRIVMEKKIGRFLKPQECIHHIDGNTLNNKVVNLELCKSHGEHTLKYHPEVIEKIIKSKFGKTPWNKYLKLRRCLLCHKQFQPRTNKNIYCCIQHYWKHKKKSL